jgi:thiol-disulfide isomerase/thioredoxin
MNPKKNRLVPTLAVVFVILAISSPHARAEEQKCMAAMAAAGEGMRNFTPTQPLVPVAEVSFDDGTGRLRSLSEYRGRGVILNFWATWCAPCIREMPSLDRLQAAVSGDGIEVLTLSEDRGGAPVVDAFVRKIQVRNLPAFIDIRGRALRKLAVVGLPTTIFIDAGGFEVGRVVGAAEWDSSDSVDFVRQCLMGADRATLRRTAPALALPAEPAA